MQLPGARLTLMLLSLAASPACRGADRNAEKPRAAAAPSASSFAVRGLAGTTPAAFAPGDAERGGALVRQFECQRCHAGTGIEAPKLEQDCVGCHEQIATDRFKTSSSKLGEWKQHVLPYRDVPSLMDLGVRLRPGWVRDYLLHPHQLRPSLAQTMPRLELSFDQATDIVTYLTRKDAPPKPTLAVTADPTQVEHGKLLLSERGCVGCHEVTGAGLTLPPKTQPVARAQGLAPDLRFARERLEPDTLALWLLDPSRLKRDAVMPNLQLSRDDARDLAAFLSFGKLSPNAAPPPPSRLPPLTRRVGFDEVSARVFAVTCRHCHTNPDLAGGDGGPGGTGGFGFKPRHIDFSSYQGILSGGVDARGQRVSLFTPTGEGVPRLVAALVARQREISGQESREVRGMPLGLPALSPEQIQLVESWVAQGRPL